MEPINNGDSCYVSIYEFSRSYIIPILSKVFD